jgi:nicotinamide-nucleotide amidase
VKLRLTGRHTDGDHLGRELAERMSAIAERLGNIVIAREDLTLEQILKGWFTANGKTLGLAESCTGGGIASLITNVPGSSKYFMGSTVSYSYEAKNDVLGVSNETIAKHGAVSEETVQEMAQGTLRVLRCDYALAVSGMLSAGTDTDKASGTVWMAVASKESMKTKKFVFPYDRMRNKDMAISMAMLMIWKFANDQI